MSNDFAALLAQVIPVVALALGLEVRALVGRYSAAKEGRGQDPVLTWDIGYWCVALTLLQIFLAAAELKALNVVAGVTAHDADAFRSMLFTALAVAFLAPCFEALARIVFTERPKLAQSGPRALVLAGMAAAMITAVLVVLAAIE